MATSTFQLLPRKRRGSSTEWSAARSLPSDIRQIDVTCTHEAADLADPTLQIVVTVEQSFNGGITWDPVLLAGVSWVGGQRDRHGNFIPLSFGVSIPNDGQQRYVRASVSQSKNVFTIFDLTTNTESPV